MTNKARSTTTQRLIAGLLNLTALSVLLLGSCAGPVALYSQSPWWFLENFDTDKAGSFFVAFMSTANDGSEQLHVVQYGTDPHKEGYTNVHYRMQTEHLSHNWGPSEGTANIYVKTEPHGDQLIKVFVVGDTPWTSLSEYHVVDNAVYPLRHARSNPWFLLSIFICLFIANRLSRPIRRGINRLVRIPAN